MLQIGAALFYYKLGQTLLQIGPASLFQIGTILLQIGPAIKNWGENYYKLGNVLQIRAAITNWCITLTSFSNFYKF